VSEKTQDGEKQGTNIIVPCIAWQSGQSGTCLPVVSCVLPKLMH
jgi:hypothetical protein